MFCTRTRVDMCIVFFATCQVLFNACDANGIRKESQQLLTKGLPSKIRDQLSLYGNGTSNSKASREDICITTPRDVRINRYATKRGFHRDIHTSVSIQPGASDDCTSCELLVIESLPSGLYVDLHQTGEAVHFGGPKIIAFEDIDVEKPAYLSEGHTILVYPPRPSHVKSTWVNFTLEMPIHLRYHRPSVDNNSARMISLQVPYMLLRCSGTTSTAARKLGDEKGADVLLYHAPCDGTSCVWQLLPQKHTDKELHFEVPVGQQEHTLIVTIVTVLTTAFGVVILLVAMTRSPKDKPD